MTKEQIAAEVQSILEDPDVKAVFTKLKDLRAGNHRREIATACLAAILTCENQGFYFPGIDDPTAEDRARFSVREADALLAALAKPTGEAKVTDKDGREVRVMTAE